jgi:acyl carrier protein
MFMKDEVIQLIITTVTETANAEGIPLPQPVAASTRLFGQEGLLDSMALVSVVIAIEQQISDKYGKGVALADEKALSQRSSPYRSVETLADYALTQLQG